MKGKGHAGEMSWAGAENDEIEEENRYCDCVSPGCHETSTDSKYFPAS